MNEPLRRSPDQSTALAWSLALSSQGIPSQVTKSGGSWVVAVPPEHAEGAERVLLDYDADQANEPRRQRGRQAGRQTGSQAERQTESQAERQTESQARRQAALHYGSTRMGIVLAVGVAAFFMVTGPYDPRVSWFAFGSSVSDRIFEGEWWRTVTALTLHVDLPHLLVNAAALAIFATAVCASLGPGLGTTLILLSGAIGNAASAAAHGSGHVAVGASTAVFGAVGILCGQQFMRRRLLRSRSAPAWLALAAGVALLALLGTAKRSDMAAHSSGLVVGMLLGALVARLLTRSPGVVLQTLGLLASAAAVCMAWLEALARQA